MIYLYRSKEFGTCPRVKCNLSTDGGKELQAVLPVGTSSELNVCTVKVYCPKCRSIFVPRGQRSTFATGSKGCKLNLDGAYFFCIERLDNFIS